MQITLVVSYCGSLGSLAGVVYYLRTLTRPTLLVEWVDPLDAAILIYGRVEPSLDYTRTEFEALQKQYFSSFEIVGKSPERLCEARP